MTTQYKYLPNTSALAWILHAYIAAISLWGWAWKLFLQPSFTADII